MSEIWLIVVFGGILTYLTRIGGYILIARLDTIPPRLEAALNAVPAAVLTTIVVPVFVEGEWPDRIAITLAAILSLRLSAVATVAVTTGLVVVARAAGF